jgi:hypothetical protein
MQVWVEYDGHAMELNVTTAPLELPKPRKPLLSTFLTSRSVVVTEPAYYVGFSSARGVIFSHHYRLSPELLRAGKASSATDVFAFALFMLEVTCGRRPLEHDLQDNQVLLDWVLEHWNKGAFFETLNSRLNGEYTMEEAELVLKLGLLCSQPMPNARPSTRQVLQHLDRTSPVWRWQ